VKLKPVTITAHRIAILLAICKGHIGIPQLSHNLIIRHPLAFYDITHEYLLFTCGGGVGDEGDTLSF